MVYVGSQIRKNISQAVFKQIVFTLLGLMAIHAIAQGLSIILNRPCMMV